MGFLDTLKSIFGGQEKTAGISIPIEELNEFKNSIISRIESIETQLFKLDNDQRKDIKRKIKEIREAITKGENQPKIELKLEEIEENM